MKAILIVAMLSSLAISSADDLKPSIDKRLRTVDINEYTFSFRILRSGMIVHEEVEFTQEQFAALAKAIYRARPSARMSFVADKGVSFSIHEPPMKTAVEIGFEDVIGFGASF